MQSPDTIIFAIKAGIQLYAAAGKAYADNTRGRSLILPLPRSAGTNWNGAVTWFAGAGATIALNYPRVTTLLNTANLTDDEKAELTELYIAARSESEPLLFESDKNGSQVNAKQINALLTVRQWSSGRYGDAPTALQTIAGTLVNIGIDYVLQKPGALSEESAEGRTLKSFLTSLDKTDFANTAVAEIAPSLMVAVLESVTANPDLLGGGEKEQALIKNISDTMLQSTKDLLDEAPSEERRKAGVWIQMIARSMIKGASDTVLENPQSFFTVTENESALIQNVGGTVTELLIGKNKVTFQKLLTQDGLNKVVKSALVAVAENPDLIKANHTGLKTILTSLADTLSKTKNVINPDIFPELARLTLEKTASNLDLIWGSKSTTKPEKNLLITASKTLLTEISRKPPAGSTWKPKLTKQQILDTMEIVADEVIDNPEWLAKKAGASDPTLGVAVKAIFASLRKLDGRKISAEAGVTILHSGIRAVALDASFLNDFPVQGEAAARKGITAALDAIFEIVFADGANAAAQWTLARNSTLVALTEVGLEELARVGAKPTEIKLLRETVAEAMEGNTPFDIDDFQTALNARLAA